MSYSYRLVLPLAKELIFPFFYDLEKWFRLNPQWEVLSYENGKIINKDARFSLAVKYDRTEEEVRYQGSVEELLDSARLTVRLHAEHPRLITMMLDNAGNKASVLAYEETGDIAPSVEEERELVLWVKSVADYIILSRKKALRSRVWKWIVDMIWLKMSPAGRRIVIFVVISELATFAFFIALILWLLIFKKF